MKTWTPQAEKRLAEYLEARVRREGFDGEEAEELRSDLRRHIHEESEKESASGIGLMQLEGILGRLDADYRPDPEPTPWWRKRVSPMSPFWTWTWGVVLPAIIIAIELTTSFCGSAFFSPLPSAWHVPLALLVPVINAWFLKGAPRATETVKGFSAALAVVFAVFFGLLFVPLLPLSLLALLFVGMGLLSLTPVFTALWTWRIGRRQRLGTTNLPDFRRGRRIGFATALLALLALEGPALWTRDQLAIAASDGAEAKAAVDRLRLFHSEKTLVRACYEASGGFGAGTDISGWLAGLGQWVGSSSRRLPASTDSATRAQEVFFRVTGKPLTSMKPPQAQGGSGFPFGRRRRPAPQWEFDSHVGGDDVALRLKNLDLSESRFDGHLDARSRLGYGEWTLVFHNRAANPQEARCQILLPRGGHVSRLTLWVNGEPREAAFNAVSKVKAAYQSVAVVQHRDPVLVTMRAPDTVMVQCFPVPSGGDMKIRIGITAPLDGDAWELPRIVERNFGFAEKLEHAVWMQGESGFTLQEQDSPPLSSAGDGPGNSLCARFPAFSLGGKALAAKMVNLPADAPVVWCEDPFASANERFLIRSPEKIRLRPSGKPLLVLDGSASLQEAKSWLIPALRDWKYEILLADDGARSLSANDLGSIRFSGGRDNEPALREAVRRAKSGEIGEIVWLHGPQAAGLSQTEALLQLLERGTHRPTIHDLAVVPGPNRLAEALTPSQVLRRGPALMEPGKDLPAFLQTLADERDVWTWRWQRGATPPERLGPPVWDHLARQWAAERTDTPQPGAHETELPALAAQYQLVTPLSGAVVLETAEQYKQHGLKPIDPNTAPQIPGVPEPSTTLLILLATSAAVFRRHRAPA